MPQAVNLEISEEEVKMLCEKDSDTDRIQIEYIFSGDAQNQITEETKS